MRWLLLKDLQILRRSPLLVALLVIYPIAIALLIGFALSKGPDKPKVAIVNQVPEAERSVSLAGEDIDLADFADELFERVEPVDVDSRSEAIRMVRDGDVLAAIIVPPDIGQRLATGIQTGRIEVAYNNEDPVKAQYVESLIDSGVAEANRAISDRFRQIASKDIDLLLNGGEFNLLGQELNILGLRATQEILESALAALPADFAQREGLESVERFASLAIANLNLANRVLGTVSEPVQVKTTALSGSRTPLDSFAVAIAVTVSLMFVTVLLAAGMLALEREEHAFTRLVRGLVTRAGLLAEKIGLSAVCAFVVALVMLCGLGIFVGLQWDRFPLWIAALAVAALAFGALGVAIGGLAREVRAASLLAFLLSLPIAFLALVPSGSVSAGLYDVVRVVSALFPFKPALQAMDNALNDSGTDFGVHLLHLAALTVGFGAIARLALRRFA